MGNASTFEMLSNAHHGRERYWHTLKHVLITVTPTYDQPRNDHSLMHRVRRLPSSTPYCSDVVVENICFRRCIDTIQYKTSYFSEEEYYCYTTEIVPEQFVRGCACSTYKTTAVVTPASDMFNRPYTHVEFNSKGLHKALDYALKRVRSMTPIFLFGSTYIVHDVNCTFKVHY